MTRALIVACLLATSIGAAYGLGLGREGLVFGRMGAAGKAGTAPAPPSSCTGAIDLSTGCVMPMLR